MLANWANGLDSRYRPAFLALWRLAQSLDPRARVTSAFRTGEEQRRLYRRYLAGQSRYPVAAPGTSKHEYGLALDLVATDETLRRLGMQWQSAGGEWGGERDPIHFAIPWR